MTILKRHWMGKPDPELEVTDIDLTNCGFLCRETAPNLTFDYITEKNLMSH